MKVVVYSHDADTRAEMKLAIGARPAPDVPEAEIVEVATAPALFRLLDAGGIDVMVLDGEAQPAGGMGDRIRRRGSPSTTLKIDGRDCRTLSC